MVALILFIIVFVGAIIIHNKTNVSMGIVLMLGAFILGGWYAGTNPATIISYFPTSVLSTLLFTTFLFGYINQTKMFNGLVDRILWKTRGRTWLYPFAIYACVFVISAVGGNDAAPVIMSPIAFSIAAATGMNPLLAVVSSYMGSAAMGMASWTPGGAVFSGLMSTGCGDDNMKALRVSVIIMIIGSIVCLLFYYFVLGGNKLKDNGKFILKEPEPFNRDQKIALTVLACVLLVTFVPAVLKNVVSGGALTVLNWITTHLALRQCCLLGVLAMALLKIGDGREVVKDKIPWGVMIDIGGAVMIINTAKDMGIIDMISSFASNALPAFLVPAVCVLIAGLLSFVSNAMAILPMFCPIVAEIATATGHNPAILCACLLVGCIATGISPVSMGGSLHSMGANKEQREAIFGKQFGAAFVHLLIYIVFALIGLFPLVGKIFGL